MPEKICFVVMGFGTKTDYKTGRQLDLDKTFECLIKPVFDELKITCIRASDIPHSGVIDVPMYENILKADIVVADISTLNPNAIYELGVRHALRPETTIVIAEKEMVNPFDLNHILINHYEHLGKDIGMTEAKRFCKQLKGLVETVLNNPKVDSPVYTFLEGLNPPQFTKQEIKELKKVAENQESVSALLKEAEELKSVNKFPEALEKLSLAQKQSPANPFIIQRLALITYKSKQPDKVSALKQAEKILKSLQPETTNDTETLGLLGAINKRLYEEMNLPVYLQKAIYYYQRGFVISRDYYNGINLAFLYLASSANATDKNEKIADYINAKRVRAKTREISLRLTENENFSEMNDRVWILLTLAEIENVENNIPEAEKYVAAARAEGAKDFEISSYQEQQKKLEVILKQINIEE